MKRPISIYAGSGLVLLRVLSGIAVLIGIWFGWHGFVVDLEASVDGFEPTDDVENLARGVVIGIGAVFVLVDALFGFFVFLGRNAARVIVMLVSTGSIVSSFLAWWAQGQEIKIDTTFVSLSLDILILLALSSRSAAAYARRHERR